MQDSISYLRVLYSFYTNCLAHGAVKITRQDSNLFTIYTNNNNFFHFTEALAVNVKKVCYVFPSTSRKMVDCLSKVLSPEYDSYLCSIDPKKRYINIKLIDSNGRVEYKTKLRYFTINIGRIKKSEPNNI